MCLTSYESREQSQARPSMVKHGCNIHVASQATIQVEDINTKQIYRKLRLTHRCTMLQHHSYCIYSLIYKKHVTCNAILLRLCAQLKLRVDLKIWIHVQTTRKKSHYRQWAMCTESRHPRPCFRARRKCKSDCEHWAQASLGQASSSIVSHVKQRLQAHTYGVGLAPPFP